jgi:NADH:ubiquinone oxidoreductase subunit E
MLLGGEDIYSHISNKLKIGHNQRTEDGKFSLEEVECMGACGGAPMIAINEDYHEFVSINEVDKLIESLG